MKDDFRSLTLAVFLSFLAIYSVNHFFGLNKAAVATKPAVESDVSLPAKSAQVEIETPIK